MLIIFSVETVQEKLAKFVRMRMDELSLTSTYKVAARSGGLLSNTTVWNVLNGTYKDIGVLTLKGFAKALDVDEDTIFNLVKDRPADLNDFQKTAFYELSVKFERLSEPDKSNMEQVLEMVKREFEWRGRVKSNTSIRNKPAEKIGQGQAFDAFSGQGGLRIPQTQGQPNYHHSDGSGRASGKRPSAVVKKDIADTKAAAQKRINEKKRQKD